MSHRQLALLIVSFVLPLVAGFNVGKASPSRIMRHDPNPSSDEEGSANYGETLKAKMDLAILLEQQGKTAEARQVYGMVMEGLTQHLDEAVQSSSQRMFLSGEHHREADRPSLRPGERLHQMARSAVSDAMSRRAPKREAPASLVAVNAGGSFVRQGSKRQALTDMRDMIEDAEPAVPHGTKATNLTAAATAKGDGNMTKANGGFLMAVTTEQLIPFYYGVVPLVVIVCIAFECVHRRWAGIDLNEPIPNFERGSEAGEGMAVENWLEGYWPLSQKFFFEGEMKGMARLLLLVLLFLSFWSLFMDWARNIWQRDFWDSIEARHTNRFWKAMLCFILMAIVNVLSQTYQSYVTSILTIRWRAKLTKDLQEKWLVGRAFCVQHFPPTAEGVSPLDNPDQRLQEDVAGFIGGGLGIFFGVIMCVGRLALFTPILFMLSPNYAFGIWYCPGWLLYVAIIYSGLGSMFTHFAGRWLIPLNFIKQQVEADYRHTAVQVRDNTESIALYGAEETENARLTNRFDKIQRVVWEQMKFGKQLGFFRNFYFLANDIVPFCILAGNYFKGQITLGQMMQILGALGHVSDSLNAFVGAYTDLADLRATTDRLHGFFKAVEKGASFVDAATISKEVSPPGDNAALYAQDVCVRVKEHDSGNERILWNKAGLVVQPGERVLLLGPDGCGKSVFLRALAGSWPATGSCRIGRGDALFIPQRPFVPAGELREAVAYPEKVACYSDEDIISVLHAVKLTSLDDVPLSEVAEWTRRLSGGELQRLAIAHALLRKPGLLVLDETTAAIGEDGTHELYALLAKSLPPSTAVISVDHDAIREVGNWHNVHYTLNPSTHQWIPTSTPG